MFFIYLIICIHSSFSYDFTESNRQNLYVRNNRKHNIESQVVQLDMESFMSSDDPQDYEPFDFKSKLNRGAQIEDNYESPLNKFKREEIADYSNLKEVNNIEAIGTLKDDTTLNVPAFYKAEKEKKISAAEEKQAEDISFERYTVQDPEKKCLFRNMKIPFFSHKKTKQHKRRKLVCMNCGGLYKNDPESQANEKVNQLTRRLKRAYGNVCPNCIRNLLQRFHKKQLAKSIKPDEIHDDKKINKMMTTTVSRGNEVEKKHKDDNFEYYNMEERTKRQKVKERQMKDLAELEMKVEKVKYTTPKVSG